MRSLLFAAVALAGLARAQDYCPAPAEDDTPQTFLDNPDNHDPAKDAPVPSGYRKTFTNLNAAVYDDPNDDPYLTVYYLDSYSVQSCASYCDAVVACNAFNIYFERDPQVEPVDSCRKPASKTVYKCALFGNKVMSFANAQNVGQWRNDFYVVITGSNGYQQLGGGSGSSSQKPTSSTSKKASSSSARTTSTISQEATTKTTTVKQTTSSSKTPSTSSQKKTTVTSTVKSSSTKPASSTQKSSTSSSSSKKPSSSSQKATTVTSTVDPSTRATSSSKSASSSKKSSSTSKVSSSSKVSSTSSSKKTTTVTSTIKASSSSSKVTTSTSSVRVSTTAKPTTTTCKSHKDTFLCHLLTLGQRQRQNVPVQAPPKWSHRPRVQWVIQLL